MGGEGKTRERGAPGVGAEPVDTKIIEGRPSEGKHENTPRAARAGDAPGLEVALELLSLGLRPFPVDHKTKSPLVQWREFQARPPTEDQVRGWWMARPHAAVAIVTGHPGGLCCLDIDRLPKDGQRKQLPNPWPGDPEKPLPAGWIVESPSGGRLHFFRTPAGDPIPNSVGILAPGVDIRAEGGMAIVSGPGRATVCGSPAEALGTDCPGWLLEAIRAARAKPRGRGAQPLAKPVRESDPSRNATLASVAGSLRARGADPDTVEAALLAVNARCAHPPLPEAEVRKIAASICTYPPGGVRYHHTDVGNADRFVARWGKEVRWCGPLRRWFVWDGRRWAEDRAERVTDCAKLVARMLYSEAGDETDPARRRELDAWARSSEHVARITAMTKLAKPDLAVLPEALDRDPWLLNVLNGTVDLRTGELRPHNPADLITKLAPVEYNPDATDPILDRFLADTTGGDKDFEAFLQRFAGYCLTGDVSEEVFVLVLGPSTTGKSTFVQSLLATLGDYAVKAQFDTFLERRDPGAPRSDLVALRGARLVAAVETAATRQLAEPIVKELVGGDTITVSPKYAGPVSFKPTCKLVLAANEPPKMSAKDDALWRRARMIPFTQVVSAPDPTIKAHLSKPNPALLAWAVRGCLAWQRQRLGTCEAVTTGTFTLRQSMNPLLEFVKDRCALGDKLEVTAGELRYAYETWCVEMGERPVGGKAWGRSLEALGGRSAQRRIAGRVTKIWTGIGLRHDDGPPGAEGVTGVTAKGSFSLKSLKENF